VSIRPEKIRAFGRSKEHRVAPRGPTSRQTRHRNPKWGPPAPAAMARLAAREARPHPPTQGGPPRRPRSIRRSRLGRPTAKSRRGLPSPTAAAKALPSRRAGISVRADLYRDCPTWDVMLYRSAGTSSGSAAPRSWAIWARSRGIASRRTFQRLPRPDVRAALSPTLPESIPVPSPKRHSPQIAGATVLVPPPPPPPREHIPPEGPPRERTVEVCAIQRAGREQHFAANRDLTSGILNPRRVRDGLIRVIGRHPRNAEAARRPRPRAECRSTPAAEAELPAERPPPSGAD